MLGVPNFISGLPNNIILTSASQNVDITAAFQGPGKASIDSFDTGHDILQIPKQQAASFNTLTFSESAVPADPGDFVYTTRIGLPRGATTDLPFVTQNSLTPANLRFV